MNTLAKKVAETTIVDDMYAVCALLFLVCVYLIFFALRVRSQGLTTKLIKLIDSIFLFSMTCMTVAAFVMVYTVWQPSFVKILRMNNII